MVSRYLADENERLATLARYRVLDTECEESFDRIARIASVSLQCPIALVSLVDKNRQWFKARVGLDVSQTPRDISFCTHAIATDEIFSVEDATKDERFSKNPLVNGAPNIKFYAGAPLITPEGHRLGTLCVIDRSAHKLSLAQSQLLTDLAVIVMETLELRRLRLDISDMKAA